MRFVLNILSFWLCLVGTSNLSEHNLIPIFDRFVSFETFDSSADVSCTGAICFVETRGTDISKGDCEAKNTALSHIWCGKNVSICHLVNMPPQGLASLLSPHNTSVDPKIRFLHVRLVICLNCCLLEDPMAKIARSTADTQVPSVYPCQSRKSVQSDSLVSSASELRTTRLTANGHPPDPGLVARKSRSAW